jgi:hypothetical protein
MKPRDVTRRFHIYTDFWLGLASAGAQGLADVASALKEEREKDHGLDGAVAVGMKAVLDAASEAMNKVATEAEHVKEQVDKERKRIEQEKAERAKDCKEAVPKAKAADAAVHDKAETRRHADGSARERGGIPDNAEKQRPVDSSGQ